MNSIDTPKISPGPMRRAAVAALATLAVLALAGSATAASPNDAWITTRAKIALLTNEGLGSTTAINVDTVNRKVTLHGTVASAEEKQKAEEAVRSINGVTSVRNFLEVSSTGRTTSGRENDKTGERTRTGSQSDDEIAKDVRAALQRKTSLDDSTITVASVHKGTVTLSGDAASMGDELTAVRTARMVPGVDHVRNEIKSTDRVTEANEMRGDRTDRNDEGVMDKTRDAARSTGHAVTSAAKSTGKAVEGVARTTMDEASDMYTTSAVKMRLLANRDTPAMDINVDTDDGVVTLFGEVPSAKVKTEAAAEARKVSSVKNVRNELRVVASANGSEPRMKKPSDQELASNVKQRLRENDALKDVDIRVNDCEVRLAGRVPSSEERLEAMQVARATPGVCAVRDDLRYQ